ncbi:hypothetical protein M9Y10_024991 [Tritrichomonas musculus]|uniref:Uncharacterized protein n=1 Tax=Tritrichomonas musculus TaxID=1915356 RepID=A0ABR2HBR3_9EUKA
MILNEGMFHTPNEVPPILILPKDEKAISVACMEELFYVLSNNGKVYKYVLPPEIPPYPLVTEIDELKNIRIVHFLVAE